MARRQEKHNCRRAGEWHSRVRTGRIKPAGASMTGKAAVTALLVWSWPPYRSPLKTGLMDRTGGKQKQRLDRSDALHVSQVEYGMEQPQTYWVIGTGTNVGKTTVATALISILNSRGIATIGFKPFSAAKLPDIMDILDDPKFALNNLICSSDGLSLSASSLGVGELEAELVHPVLFVCYPDYSDTFIIRSGSRISGDVCYWRGEHSDDVLGNAALFLTRKHLQLENWKSFPVSRYGFLDARRLGSENVERCYQHLLNAKRLKVVVCEGAAYFLPQWGASQSVNHIILVSSDTVTFYRDLDLEVPEQPSMVKSSLFLRDVLRKCSAKSVSVPYPRSTDPKATSASVVDRLLAS